MKKIVCIHLYNDFSGSPLILSSVIKGFRAEGHEVDLFTCGTREGFLSNLDIEYHHFPYQFVENKYIRLIVFMTSQMILFFKLLKYRKQDVIFYVNTLLPFGAGLAGRILGKKVVYHIHETSVKPPIFKKLLKGMANANANAAIYVSHDLMNTEKLPDVTGKVVYNGLSQDFISKASLPLQFDRKEPPFTILMLCSLKDYKGVKEFVQLAEMLPNLHFDLVMNATEQDIDAYFGERPSFSNLTLYSTQRNVHPFFQKANLVLNLSNPETWVETFGMTILEAMHYGIPCIVPPVGGPIELIENGVEGYLTDQRELEKVKQQIEQLATDDELYENMAKAAKEKSKLFSVENMKKGAIETIRSVS